MLLSYDEKCGKAVVNVSECVCACACACVCVFFRAYMRACVCACMRVRVCVCVHASVCMCRVAGAGWLYASANLPTTMTTSLVELNNEVPCVLPYFIPIVK